jgi:hypothetical protein
MIPLIRVQVKSDYGNIQQKESAELPRQLPSHTETHTKIRARVRACGLHKALALAPLMQLLLTRKRVSLLSWGTSL